MDCDRHLGFCPAGHRAKITLEAGKLRGPRRFLAPDWESLRGWIYGQGSVIRLPSKNQPDPSPLPAQSKGGAEESTRLATTQSFIGFVRSELIKYQKLKSIAGNKRSDEWLCGEILSCEAVNSTVNFSGETLRRFRRDKQKTSPVLIKAVADYLLYMKWISERDVAVHAQETNVRAAVSLSEFLKIDSGNSKIIFEPLSGQYIQYWIDSNRVNKLIRASIYFTYDQNTEVTTVVEEIARFEIVRGDLLQMFHEPTQSPPVSSYCTIDRLLPRGANRVGAPEISRGFAIGDQTFLAILLVDELSHFSKLYTIGHIVYEGDNVPSLLCGLRHESWGTLLLESLVDFTPERLRQPKRLPIIELCRR